MSDHSINNKAKKQDNVSSRQQDWDVKTMMNKFNVTEKEVQMAVQAVGDHREKVEAFLRDMNNRGI
jgi:hypothetical protein